MLRNVHKGCIPGSVRTLLPELIYPQWSIILHVVRLVTQGPSGLSGVVPDMRY